MTPSGSRPAAPSRHASILVLAAGLLVAACSGSAATPAPVATVAGATATATAVPTSRPIPVVTTAPTLGPATQQLTLTGSAGTAVAVSSAGVRCSLPSTDGLQISVLGRPADPNLSVYIFVQAGNVSVRYDSGSGSTYVERDFAGTGVTEFDAATGATIDSQLTEVPNNDAHGSLGVFTSISGTVDCGNQMPGSSTSTFSGPTLKGTLSGGLSPVNVECVTNTYGQSVSVLGVVQVGATPTFVVFFISPGTMSASLSGDGFYRNTSTAQATLTANGAHVDGDLLEQNVAKGAKTHTIHVSGDVVCGTTIGG
jgi:hypothetical protein